MPSFRYRSGDKDSDVITSRNSKRPYNALSTQQQSTWRHGIRSHRSQNTPSSGTPMSLMSPLQRPSPDSGDVQIHEQSYRDDPATRRTREEDDADTIAAALAAAEAALAGGPKILMLQDPPQHFFPGQADERIQEKIERRDDEAYLHERSDTNSPSRSLSPQSNETEDYIGRLPTSPYSQGFRSNSKVCEDETSVFTEAVNARKARSSLEDMFSFDEVSHVDKESLSISRSAGRDSILSRGGRSRGGEDFRRMYKEDLIEERDEYEHSPRRQELDSQLRQLAFPDAGWRTNDNEDKGRDDNSAGGNSRRSATRAETERVRLGKRSPAEKELAADKSIRGVHSPLAGALSSQFHQLTLKNEDICSDDPYGLRGDDNSIGGNSKKSTSSHTAFEMEITRFRRRVEAEDRHYAARNVDQHVIDGDNTRHFRMGEMHGGDGESELIRELEATVAELRKENSLLTKQHRIEVQNKESFRQELANCKKEMHHLKGHLHAVQIEKEVSEKRLIEAESSSEDIHEMQRTIDNLDEKLSESHATISTLKKALDAKSNQKVPLHQEKEVSHLRKCLSESRKNNLNLVNELATMKKKLQDAEEKFGALADESRPHESHKEEELEKKLKQEASKIGALERGLSIKDRAVKTLEAKVSDMSKAIEEERSRNERKMKELQQELAKCESNSSSWEAMLDESEATVARLEKEKQDLEIRLEEQKTDLTKKLSEKEIETATRRSEMERDIESLRKRIELSEQEKASIEKKLQTQIEAVKRSKEVVQDYEGHLRDCHSAVTRLEKALEAKEVSMVALRLEANELKDRLEKGEKDRTEITQRFESEIESLKKEKDTIFKECESKLKTSEEQLKRADNAAREETSEILKGLESQVKKMEKEHKVTVEDYQSRLHECEAQLQRAENSATEQMSYIQERSESQIETMKKRHQIVVDDYELKLSDCQEQLNSLNRTNSLREKNENILIASLRSEIQALKTIDSTSQEEVCRLKNEVESSRGKVSDQSQRIELLKCENGKLKKDMESVKGEYERDRNEELTSKASFESQIHEKCQDIERLTKELEESTRMNAALKEDINVLENALAELETNIRRSNSRTSEDGDQSISSLRLQLQDALRQKEDLELKVKEQEALLSKAETIISQTNTATIGAVMNAMNGKASTPETLSAIMNAIGKGSNAESMRAIINNIQGGGS